jgi:hypothetical protein
MSMLAQAHKSQRAQRIHLSELGCSVRPQSVSQLKEEVMSKMIFVNLPVRNLAASTAFYIALGGEVNHQFSGEQSTSLMFSDAIGMMLLTYDHYRQYRAKGTFSTRITRPTLRPHPTAIGFQPEYSQSVQAALQGNGQA